LGSVLFMICLTYLVAVTWGLSSRFAGTGACTFFLVVPFLNLVFFGFLLYRATRFLREAGVKASFLGASRAELRRFESELSDTPEKASNGH